MLVKFQVSILCTHQRYSQNTDCIAKNPIIILLTTSIYSISSWHVNWATCVCWRLQICLISYQLSIFVVNIGTPKILTALSISSSCWQPSSTLFLLDMSVGLPFCSCCFRGCLQSCILLVDSLCKRQLRILYLLMVCVESCSASVESYQPGIIGVLGSCLVGAKCCHVDFTILLMPWLFTAWLQIKQGSTDRPQKACMHEK